jgi:membrane protein DedA with SNARE-associated domain/rhodanese-related sulfurtransferase
MSGSLQLTYMGVLLAVFAQQLCLPIPSVVFLMTAGALSVHGRMHTSIVVSLGVLGCLAADGIWFWFGRRWGSQAMRLLCRLTPDPRQCSRNAHEKFRRYGLSILSVAKFLPGLDCVMPPLAGAEGVSITGFLIFDVLGGLLWSGFYVALGYFLSGQLDVALGWAKHFATTLAIAIGVPVTLYALWRGLALVRMIHRLRVRRITPAMLDRKLKSNKKVAVLDLLNFEEETEGERLEAIPGAVRIDPSILRKHPHITIPDDVDIVLYCPSGHEMVSARAAVGLKRIGVDKVWVLEGGLNAWREHGFPVSQCLEAPEVVAERYGVKLPKPSLSRATSVVRREEKGQGVG